MKLNISLVGTGQFAREITNWSKSGMSNFEVKYTQNSSQFKSDYPFFVSIGNVQDRYKVGVSLIDAFFKPSDTLLIGTQLVANDVTLSNSTLLMNNVSIADRCVIGSFTDVHANCVIGHGVKIGQSCSLGANVFIGGEAKISDRVQIFPAVNIAPGVHICSDVKIGIGSTVIKSITKPGVYFGSPAVLIL